jgi:hypothetical protein
MESFKGKSRVMALMMSRFLGKGYYFGDYSLFFDKPAEYDFVATT